MPGYNQSRWLRRAGSNRAHLSSLLLESKELLYCALDVALLSRQSDESPSRSTRQSSPLPDPGLREWPCQPRR